jgi:oligopeptide transport system substrate-binding protein
MAVDRDFIAHKLLRGGQIPAYGFIPPGIGYEHGARTYWAGWSFEQRQAEARRLLAAAGYGPDHALHLTIKHRNSPDPTLFMPSVQADWKQIGVAVDLQQNDVQVAYQEYEIHDFQVGDAGWQSPDPLDYLELEKADAGGNNFGGYNNPAYDAELKAAENAINPADSDMHARKAEQILLTDAPLAPIYFPASRNLVNPAITGWINNPLDTHGAHWLCRGPSVPAGMGVTVT